MLGICKTVNCVSRNTSILLAMISFIQLEIQMSYVCVYTYWQKTWMRWTAFTGGRWPLVFLIAQQWAVSSVRSPVSLPPSISADSGSHERGLVQQQVFLQKHCTEQICLHCCSIIFSPNIYIHSNIDFYPWKNKCACFMLNSFIYLFLAKPFLCR